MHVCAQQHTSSLKDSRVMFIPRCSAHGSSRYRDIRLKLILPWPTLRAWQQTGRLHTHQTPPSQPSTLMSRLLPWFPRHCAHCLNHAGITPSCPRFSIYSQPFSFSSIQRADGSDGSRFDWCGPFGWNSHYGLDGDWRR